MSFILESIKQAERERKLGQQAPSISIEYTGANVDEIENNKSKWMLLSLALLITAMVVWGATYYFANKDRQYMDQYAEELAFTEKTSPAKVENQKIIKGIENTEKRDIAMVPIKSVHKSKLKSVKVINADEKAPETKVAEVVKVESSLENIKTRPAEKIVVEHTLPKIVEKSTVVSNKQELASIYTDLAKTAKKEELIEQPNVNVPRVNEQREFDETPSQNLIDSELVQIETASYVVPETNTIKASQPESSSHSVTMPAAPQHAVNTGVPSFGELPYDIQEKLPDFNVSVHMFHAEPTQRRIRINGQMYTEGKSLQQDLALVEITRYGAVFDYQGHLFRFDVR